LRENRLETTIIIATAVLLTGKAAWQTALGLLNRSWVREKSHAPPEAVRQAMDAGTFSRSVAYTLDKNRFELFSVWYGAIILAMLLFSGILPWLYHHFSANGTGVAILGESLFLLASFFVVAWSNLPLEYYSRFRLEERYGFNKSTLRLWVSDKVKGLVIGLVMGAPLVSLIIFLISRMGDWWWLWAFALVFVFQLAMMIVYPLLILPWFNKLSPLPAGELQERLMALAERTGFKARTIQIMDGSKRSGHSNAFFTGFGRFRRIVFFDTLISQLEPKELEAVLAHEIGHYKKGHVPKMLALSAGMILAGFGLAARLLKNPLFIQAFGFDPEPAGPAPALLLFALLAGLVTFWLSPVLNRISRKFEYEADRFAATHAGGMQPMIMALRKLSEKNLSNLTPHPLYSGFYHSHPTLPEREKSLSEIFRSTEK
jgi:STE24 endopeptidase